MSIPIACQCGKSYNLKNKFAGKTLKCPHCGATLRVKHRQGSPTFRGDSAFNRDKFLLRRNVLSISERYDVCDEQGNPILYIERPAHFLRNLGTTLAVTFTAVFLYLVLFALVNFVPEALQGFLVLLAVFVPLVTALVVMSLLYKKRHLTIYRDKSKQEPLLKVLQDKKFEFLTATFTLRDAEGELAKFQTNYLYDIVRKKWNCYAYDGSLLCIVKGDYSIILALLGRFLRGRFGLFRINFIIFQGKSDRVIGEFNRNFTLLDCYVLDMSADIDCSLDRRIAIALGVMLDADARRTSTKNFPG